MEKQNVELGEDIGRDGWAEGYETLVLDGLNYGHDNDN